MVGHSRTLLGSSKLSFHCAALHELDPVFRKVTLENERIRALVRDLKFHLDPVGKISRSSMNVITDLVHQRFSQW